mmetsp:Transcript_35858/g.94229  ORF Transcript_35858/g.94229 Transcript_35858/m.94229 type:complete len:386 (-) Transcript_35858:450-1607(-)
MVEKTLSRVASVTCSASVPLGSWRTASAALRTMFSSTFPIESSVDADAIIVAIWASSSTEVPRDSAYLCTVCSAAVTAPHLVCPVTTSSFVCRCDTAYSALPISEPRADAHVLPAFRRTKRSPGRMSKRISMGARESAHPSTTAIGFCPPSDSRTSRWGSWPLVNMPPNPAAYRRLPAYMEARASSAGTGGSEAVRTGSAGGGVASSSESAGCCPRKITLPVSTSRYAATSMRVPAMTSSYMGREAPRRTSMVRKALSFVVSSHSFSYEPCGSWSTASWAATSSVSRIGCTSVRLPLNGVCGTESGPRGRPAAVMARRTASSIASFRELPSTTSTGGAIEPRASASASAYSHEPTTPSLRLHVLPIVRMTWSSPGMASKSESIGM